ncbi:hypothetical protein KBW71_03430 [Hydrogenophaga aromaticivorans]|uniref:hypothetical protein n=1 Tax=Hydrogenophaga aromaticivorans TaxID=2610898 RepID=UPI001B36BBE1|nr:hypothetical protein [Hydrogenophaga aromaticivorans]MBQ0917481.1 hypothetical protein [Hydrogenophaga aromaticivorans]
MSNNTETEQFARSPLGGKKSAVMSIRMTDEQKMDMERQAHLCGMSASEWAEKNLAVALYGLEAVIDSERMRTEMVCGLFTQSVAKVGGRA